MAEATYTFNKILNGSKFMLEVHDSAITTCIARVDVVGNTSYCVFKDTLSNDEETALNDLVSAHDATPVEEDIVRRTSFVENENCSHLDLTYRMVPHLYTVPASAGPHVFDISFPYDIMLLGGTVEVSAANLGDSVQFETVGKTVVGQLISACAEGDNHVHVNLDAVASYIWKAFDLYAVTLDQYGQISTSVDLGHVISKAGTEIMLESVLTAQQAFSAGTYIATRYVAVEKYKLLREQTIWISRDTDRGALIPKNTPMKFSYWNDAQVNNEYIAKEIQIVLEIYV